MSDDTQYDIVNEELTLLEQVRDVLQAKPSELRPNEKGIHEDLADIRAEMATASGDDLIALMDQYHSRSALIDQLRAAQKTEQVDPSSPYFAHMRLKERGRERDLCLGKATRIESGLRIVDWRNAPISRVFYQYRQGDEYEEEMAGRLVEGTVVARRTVNVRDGELRSVQAPEGTFSHNGEAWTRASLEAPKLAGGEGAALQWHPQGGGRQLGGGRGGPRRRTDKHLPDIAGLIDPDQFDLITSPDGFVVIRGGAGSGKTTVALHRIAWLAFNDERINSSRTLFLVFSRALRDYVSHVMPALGVGNVKVRSFRRWAASLRERHFPNLPKKVREDTPAVVVALKSHPAMLKALEWQVEQTPGKATSKQAVQDWLAVITDPGLLKEAVAATVPGSMTDEQIQRATRWCSDRHNELLEWMQDDAELRELLREEGRSEIPGGELDEEDDSLLLRAWQLRVGPLRGPKQEPLALMHVAIDEVQDFSPIDVRVVMDCLDDKKSITLAGDTQQHVMKDAGFTSWSDFFEHLGASGTAINTLKVSYRCTRQVVEFAIALLGDLREDDPPLVTRSGPEVEIFPFSDHGACVSFLAEALQDLVDSEPMASVAVLTPNSAMSALYYDGLHRADVSSLHRATDQNFTFAPGVQITEVDQVKGLEFDYVVLVEVSEECYPDNAPARRMLHMGATRAIHQLWLTSVGKPSAIVRAAGRASS
jgi:DNA helicase-2/ATP-dependent DNA helicase PcrA